MMDWISRQIGKEYWLVLQGRGNTLISSCWLTLWTVRRIKSCSKSLKIKPPGRIFVHNSVLWEKEHLPTQLMKIKIKLNLLFKLKMITEWSSRRMLKYLMWWLDLSWLSCNKKVKVQSKHLVEYHDPDQEPKLRYYLEKEVSNNGYHDQMND